MLGTPQGERDDAADSQATALVEDSGFVLHRDVGERRVTVASATGPQGHRAAPGTSVGVIGAGPAGLTAAFVLARAGLPVTVYEASGQVGGLARSFELWGQTVDVGPHRFFSTDTRVNRLWLDVVGDDYTMVNRLTRIFYNSRFFHYPIQPVDALRNLGAGTAALCVASYLRQKVAPTPDAGTFESWVTNRFGSRLYQIFFKHYSEKLWGIPCAELDADFAAQRIKKLSLGEAIKSACGLSRVKHKTLVDEFAYPHGGTGIVYERMADRIRENGGTIRLESPIRRVVTRDGRAVGVETTDGGFHPHDHVVSSMPLTLLVQTLDEAGAAARRAAESLRFRNTILVYLQVDGSDVFPDNWIYVHSPELRTGRVTNFRNWVPHLHNGRTETILALELWCDVDDPLWTADDRELISIATRDFTAMRIGGPSRVIDGHVLRISRCYPVYARGYREHVAVIRSELERFAGLQVIGRYGAFKYNNQDHSILMGLLAAENVVSGTRHDLWGVNTDYEYQERTLITATGLVPTAG